jgi:hypothetical protein
MPALLTSTSIPPRAFSAKRTASLTASGSDRSAAKASASLIGQEAYNNRQLLFKVMKAGGLKPISNEWWHFQEGDNATGRANGKYVK